LRQGGSNKKRPYREEEKPDEQRNNELRPKSATPATPGATAAERNPNLEITTDDAGRLNYNSGAATGHVPIAIPSLPGSPRETESLLARNFGQHVISKIEGAMSRQDYMTSGATQGPSEIFRHYLASARGAELLDKATLARMAGLAKEFEEEPDREEFFRQVLKPWLGSLTPKRR